MVVPRALFCLFHLSGKIMSLIQGKFKKKKEAFLICFICYYLLVLPCRCHGETKDGLFQEEELLQESEVFNDKEKEK